MKIYVLGSNTFMHKMVEVTDKLIFMGVDAFIAEDYRKLVAGEKNEQLKMWDSGEKAKVKIQNDYFKYHYKHILESDAILLVNQEKNGMPENLTYQDEIIALQPICLNGDLSPLTTSF